MSGVSEGETPRAAAGGGMRRRARVDANHAAVRGALRLCGWVVVDLSATGRGLPDLVAVKAGRCVFIEVKDGSRPPSARRLTPDQERLHADFAAKGFPVRVITSVDEVAQL